MADKRSCVACKEERMFDARRLEGWVEIKDMQDRSHVLDRFQVKKPRARR